ncbi:methionine--tRNA ligase subunit beta [candidate division WOR-1 bacterium RIFOXYB2_FULL_48_7]|uniref:Methionine--tRNA ligase n=1 Tax=candidate division WOR-1 bacterium RIFOXYB2_FULL_48_7 TaxID=1802583 RepID=A0A1F4TKU3_UNCSA|nr:MAG: methionine--tRNA ligase subunit beta [candidate division WOR-1 bacterium RIFOXYB2_FULL_48_7]
MENVTFEDFKKMDIRVAEIKTAEEIAGADKLYKLTVNVGDEERTLVAGIKQYYQIEQIIGKKVLVLANLEPRVIRGIESRGMILCASDPDRTQVVCTTVEKEIAPGAKVS